MSLDDNARTEYKARELKSVFLDATATFLKLVLHKGHTNPHNLFNQVGPLPPPPPRPRPCRCGGGSWRAHAPRVTLLAVRAAAQVAIIALNIQGTAFGGAKAPIAGAPGGQYVVGRPLNAPHMAGARARARGRAPAATVGVG